MLGAANLIGAGSPGGSSVKAVDISGLNGRTANRMRRYKKAATAKMTITEAISTSLDKRGIPKSLLVPAYRFRHQSRELVQTACQRLVNGKTGKWPCEIDFTDYPTNQELTSRISTIHTWRLICS